MACAWVRSIVNPIDGFPSVSPWHTEQMSAYSDEGDVYGSTRSCCECVQGEMVAVKRARAYYHWSLLQGGHRRETCSNPSRPSGLWCSHIGQCNGNEQSRVSIYVSRLVFFPRSWFWSRPNNATTRLMVCMAWGPGAANWYHRRWLRQSGGSFGFYLKRNSYLLCAELNLINWILIKRRGAQNRSPPFFGRRVLRLRRLCYALRYRHQDETNSA